MLSVGLSYMAFIMLSSIHSFYTQSFFFFLIIKECCVLSNAFSASVGMITWFSFILLMDCVCRFVYVEPSLHPADRPHSVMVCDPFTVFLSLACSCFVENFWTRAHQGCQSCFLFSTWPYLALVSGQCWSCWMSLELFLPFNILLQFEEDWHKFFKGFIGFASEAVQSWILCIGRCLIIDSL